MAHVILGLLLIAPQSLYDLVRAFDSGIALFYSASSGSIKRALDGLLARGSIEVASVEPGARGRKVYRVTESGREEFHTWITGEVRGPDVEATALSRLFFLGLLDEGERAAVLSGIVAWLESGLGRLESLEAQVAVAEIPDGMDDVARYQRATLDYGLDSYRHTLAWFRELHETHRRP